MAEPKITDAKFEVISGPTPDAPPPEPRLEPYAGESPWEHDSRVAVEKFHHREWLRRQPWTNHYTPPDWRYYSRSARARHHIGVLVLVGAFCALMLFLIPIYDWLRSLGT